MSQSFATLHMESLINKLIYVPIWVNGISIKAMIDMGATYNCLASKEVARLGLNMEKNAKKKKIKPLNDNY